MLDEPIVLPSLDITQKGKLTAYYDDESIQQDLGTTVVLVVLTDAIIKILEEEYNEEMS